MKARHPRCLLEVLNHRMHTLVEAALAGSDWRREWVPSAVQGISRLESGPLDVVLTQDELPDSTGRELLLQMLSIKSGLPIVFLAPPDAEQEIAAALAHGAAGYAVTGSALPTLLRAVLEHAVHASRTRELERLSRDLHRHSELRELCTTLRHELNNPLTGILGNAELALSSPNLAPPLAHRLGHIVRMAEQMRDVLHDLERFPDQPSHLFEAAVKSG